jgi:hypothetical protein
VPEGEPAGQSPPRCFHGRSAPHAYVIHALLRPLVNAIERHVLSGAKLHADDTPVPVLEPGKGQTKTGRLWAYVRDERPAADDTPPAVWFAYPPNRRGEHPQARLKCVGLEPHPSQKSKDIWTRDFPVAP